jgi:hypothetical protein
MKHDREGLLLFPPQVAIEVKALACQLPLEFNRPLSRFTACELGQLVIERGITASISGMTVWRWLNEDAIKPWQYRSWIFPRDPDFQSKAGVVLDLYHRIWNGKPLRENDFVISADEKTSIQARRRIHPTTYPRPGQTMRIEFEYDGWAHWRILRHGMFIEQKFLGVAKKLLELIRSMPW